MIKIKVGFQREFYFKIFIKTLIIFLNYTLFAYFSEFFLLFKQSQFILIVHKIIFSVYCMFNLNYNLEGYSIQKASINSEKSLILQRLIPLKYNFLCIEDKFQNLIVLSLQVHINKFAFCKKFKKYRISV